VINHATANQSDRPKRKRKGDFGHQDAPREGHRSLRHMSTTFFIYFYSNIIFLLNYLDNNEKNIVKIQKAH
jgi:hypothetical protein